jgi:hypothetical protein
MRGCSGASQSWRNADGIHRWHPAGCQTERRRYHRLSANPGRVGRCPRAGYIRTGCAAFMLRMPYGDARAPIESFDFEEHSRRTGGMLWGNSAVIAACCWVRRSVGWERKCNPVRSCRWAKCPFTITGRGWRSDGVALHGARVKFEMAGRRGQPSDHADAFDKEPARGGVVWAPPLADLDNSRRSVVTRSRSPRLRLRPRAAPGKAPGMKKGFPLARLALPGLQRRSGG